MTRRVQTFLVLLATFASILGWGASSHDNSTSGSSSTSELSSSTSDGPIIQASLNTAQAVFNSLRERFERNETFGNSAADIELEQKLFDSMKSFFESLTNLGVSANYDAHSSVIRGLGKEFAGIKSDDPDKQKKEDSIRSKIKAEYDRLLNQLSEAQAKNQDPQKTEDYINAQKTLQLAAAIHQNILNMKKTTTEQAKPKPSPDPLRTAVGVGGSAVAGPLGGAAAQVAYDAFNRLQSPPTSINHDRPFVEPTNESQESRVTTRPPNEQAPPPKPEKPVAEKPPKDEQKSEEPRQENPPENSTAKNDSNPSEPSHQPTETASNSTPSQNEPAASTPSFGNSGPANQSTDPTPSVGSNGKPNGFQDFTPSTTEQTPNARSIADGTHAANNGAKTGAYAKGASTQSKPSASVPFASEPPTLPVKRLPTVPVSPESPFRPFASTSSGTTSTSGQTTNAFSNSETFFAPPKGWKAPELAVPDPISEPILGVSGTRQGGIAPPPTGSDGVVNGVKILGRTPSSIQSTPNSEYKSLTGNFDAIKVNTTTFEPQTFQGIKEPSATVIKTPELQDPYVYSPGYEPKTPELGIPSIKVGEVTMFTEGDLNSPNAAEIKQASGLVNAIKVLAGNTGKADPKGILEALQEVAKPSNTAPEKTGDLKLFLKQTKKKQLDSISRILAALKGI